MTVSDKMIDKFEKMAEQYECMGALWAVPGFEEVMNKLADETLSPFAKMGKTMQFIGVCLKEQPQIVKKIIALDNDLSVDAVEAMDEKELAPMMMKVLSGNTMSFFGSGSAQEPHS